MRDIDFTHPTCPNGRPRPHHTAPEQHCYVPGDPDNPEGRLSTRSRGTARLMSRLNFRAWRGNHYLGLPEILCALGRVTVEAAWELTLEEVAPGPQGDDL